METVSSGFGVQLVKNLVPRGKVFQYHFSNQVTNLGTANKDWQRIERTVEISYRGKKEDLNFYQIVTTKIIFTSDPVFSDQALLRQIGYIFDYIEVGVNDIGFIKKVFNIDHLKLRMRNIKSYLEQDHIGEAFWQLFNGVFKLLEDEKKIIQFLQSYKMFGLYFNGFQRQFQEEITNPIFREKVLDDFNQLEIHEKITIEEKDHNYTFTVDKNSEDGKTEKYKGIYKTDYNQLVSAFMEIQSEGINIKYNVSWVG